MTHEISLISNRRRELADENERLAALIAANDVELAELAMAEKVIARLTGASRDSTVTADAEPPSPAVRRPRVLDPIGPSATAKRTYGKRPLGEVVMEIVRENAERGVMRMEPKEALDLARERWKSDAAPQDVSTTFWRLMKQGQLEKDEGTSFYRLPQKKEPADNLPGEASTGSLFETPAQGREAGPGGGT